jgi:hypothetical protein
MVHRDGGLGSLVIDLRLGKLGRLKRASGTRDSRVHADVVRTIRLLRDQSPPRWDVLALLVNGELAPLELHEAFVRGQLATLPTTDELRPLEEMARRWIRTLDRAPRTVDAYETLLLGLAGDGIILGAVPELLAARRAAALTSGKRRAFNLQLTAARMLLKGTVGERHRLYEALERVEPQRVRRRPGNPQTVDQVRQLAAAAGAHGAAVWALALSGMRRGEYFGRRWQLLPDRIAIAGTKTAAAVAKEAWRVRSMREYVAEWGANYSTVSSRLNRRCSPSRDVVTSIRLAIAALLLEGWSCATADLAWVIGFSSPQSFARHVYVMRGLRLRAWKEGGYGAEVEALHRLLCERPWPTDLLARTAPAGARRPRPAKPPRRMVEMVSPPVEPVPSPYMVLTPEIASLMLDDRERRDASRTAGAQLRLRSA